MILPIITTISDKGQVLIPVSMRRLLGLKPHGKVLLHPNIEKKQIELKVVSIQDPVEATYGMLSTKEPDRIWTKELLKDRRKDNEKDERK